LNDSACCCCSSSCNTHEPRQHGNPPDRTGPAVTVAKQGSDPRTRAHEPGCVLLMPVDRMIVYGKASLLIPHAPLARLEAAARNQGQACAHPPPPSRALPSQPSPSNSLVRAEGYSCITCPHRTRFSPLSFVPSTFRGLSLTMAISEASLNWRGGGGGGGGRGGGGWEERFGDERRIKSGTFLLESPGTVSRERKSARESCCCTRKRE
jgi:hypothetical protein